MQHKGFFNHYRGQSLENRLVAWFLLALQSVMAVFFVLLVVASWLPLMDRPASLTWLTASRLSFIACAALGILILHRGKPNLATLVFTLSLLATLGVSLFLNDPESDYPYIGYTGAVICLLHCGAFLSRKSRMMPLTALLSEATLAAYYFIYILIFHEEHYHSPNAYILSSFTVLMASILAYLARNLYQRVRNDLVAVRDTFENLAYTDPVTGLPNYNGLERSLEGVLSAARESGTAMALVGVDVDRFSRVNQSHGFDAGNKVLRELAGRITSALGPSLPAFRTAGATFAFVLGAENPGADLHAAAESFLAGVFKSPVSLGMDTVQLEYTAAMSCFPADCQEAGEMVRNVLNTLTDRAKTRVGRVTRFDEERYALARRQTRIEELVQGAVVRGEIRAVFQPKMGLADGRVRGAEILARWDNPELGPVPPAEFIPVLERTKAILPFTSFMIEAAANGIRRVARETGVSIRVAVNISPCLIHRDEVIGLVDRLSKHMDLSGIDAELTEGVFLGYDVSALEQIRQLKGRGLRLAIDDFGTGYSNIEYLQKLDADEMKIDRRFIKGADEDQRASSEILNAIISMARALDMSTVAEGVERPEQADMLRGLGCDEIQGFWFAKPMPLDDLVPFVSRRAATGEGVV